MTYSKPLAAPTLIVKGKKPLKEKPKKPAKKKGVVPRMSQSNFNQFFG